LMPLVLLLLVTLAVGQVGARPAAAAQPQDRDYIVVLKDTSGDPTSVTAGLGRVNGFKLNHVYRHAVKGFAATLSDQALAKVKSDPRVKFVVEDRMVQTTDMGPIASGDSAPTGVRRVRASTSTSVHTASSAGIAVIDTG